MKIKFILLALFLSGLVFAQVPEGKIREDFYFKSGGDTLSIPYAYVGGDTLEYMSDSVANLKVIIDDVKKEKTIYNIKGRMQNAETGESLENKGIINFGYIENCRKGRLSEGKKGVIMRMGPEYQTENGSFSIQVDSKYYDNILFLAKNYGVVSISIGRNLNSFIYWKMTKKLEETKEQARIRKQK